MITTLTGENSFLLQEQLTSVRRTFVGQYGDLALERYDGEEASYNDIQGALQSIPFLSDRKLVILLHPSANSEFTAAAPALLAELPDTTDVILVEPKLDKRTQYYSFIKSHTELKDNSSLSSQAIGQWAIEYATKLGGSMGRSIAQYLIERVGPEQRLLASEIQKLVLYEPTITKETIELLTEPTLQSTIFQLIEATFSSNPSRALHLYGVQRAQKVEPAQIVAMLSWQLHITALVITSAAQSSADIAKRAKLNPYVVSKSQAIARRLTLAQLRAHVARLMEIDRLSKTSSLDVDEALQHFILTLSMQKG